MFLIARLVHTIIVYVNVAYMQKPYLIFCWDLSVIRQEQASFDQEYFYLWEEALFMFLVGICPLFDRKWKIWEWEGLQLR